MTSKTKRASLVVLLVALAPACGLVDRWFSDEKPSHEKPGPKEPIASEQLVGVLPSMDGWETKAKQGKVNSVGADRVSLATAKYEKPVEGKVQSVELEIIDGNYISSMYSPFAVMAHSQGQMLDAHKMRIDVNGHPGLQEWKPEAGSVAVRLLVARRFIVTLRGQNVPPGDVRQTLAAVDMEKLATWARADAPAPAP
jgi:hypothetical protein